MSQNKLRAVRFADYKMDRMKRKNLLLLAFLNPVHPVKTTFLQFITNQK